jgi:hypothetical protein
MRNHLLVPLICFAVGCTIGDDDAASQLNVVVVDDEIATRVTVQPDLLSVAADAAGPLMLVQPGDVLVSQGADPFLRKVVSISNDAGQLALATEPGDLTDVLVDGHLESSRDLFNEPAVDEDTKAAVIPIGRLALNLAGKTILEESGVKVVIDRGSVTFRPVFDLDVKIAGGKISHFHALLHGDLTAAMGVKITASRNFSRSFSRTIWQSPPYRATQVIAGVPVVEVVRVSLVLSGEAHAGASGTVELGGATATASMLAGARYDAGDWTAVAAPSIALEKRGPSASASASAGASVRLAVRLDVRFYDIIGPHLTVGSYAKTEVKASTADGLSWFARLGVSGTFGGNITVLGKTLASYDRQLFDRGRTFGN